VAPDSGPYRPAPQLTQLSAPFPAYSPGEHEMQLEDAPAPMVAEKRPAPQSVQLCRPRLGPKVPAAQLVQLAALTDE
jgi:hypothetical protein